MVIVSNKPYEILLVEDNFAQIKLFEEVLKEGQKEVNLHVAPDGEAALNYLLNKDRKNPLPDLIFLDLQLPKRKGWDVLREVKTNQALSHIPVIIFTSSNREEDVRRAYELNANCYIQKPLDFEEFIHVVQSVEKLWLNSLPRLVP
jgi:two-component system, chemotaxis family, response regulator Rcp1